ncbi:uncharacterized protein Z518_09131 [Rhinocladiella mackenziei CBS 650.93]|uniref:Uncharacterized protein n=1 Tax=Rhinocladiella mackenziei CBS 650.93 TaxID=1442369 RepID=A0A0D2IXV6_9EURO|nr:uncharacterized protein Z518_09131 [Rhinocladiella mackenziei CBS 650.93]KIX01405.1 hypothetical protein Z518_09131 [Rhinocladiella mackenziei CBS 650.93]
MKRGSSQVDSRIVGFDEFYPAQGRPEAIRDAGMQGLREFIEEWPTARLNECCDFLCEEFHVNVCVSTAYRALKALNLMHKRLTRINARQDKDEEALVYGRGGQTTTPYGSVLGFHLCDIPAGNAWCGMAPTATISSALSLDGPWTGSDQAGEAAPYTLPKERDHLPPVLLGHMVHGLDPMTVAFHGIRSMDHLDIEAGAVHAAERTRPLVPSPTWPYGPRTGSDGGGISRLAL